MLDLALLAHPGQRAHQVLMLALDLPPPVVALLSVLALALVLRKRKQDRCMAVAELIGGGARGQLFGGVLVDGFEHRKARLVAPRSCWRTRLWSTSAAMPSSTSRSAG